MEDVGGSEFSATVTGLTGNTEYDVIVRAINEAKTNDGDGEASMSIPIKTKPGVVRPVINDVTTNLDTRQYILSINGFETTHGGLRYVLD